MNMVVLSCIIVVYVFLNGYLGYRGYKKTKNANDYMVAGRDIHPAVMALSYGSTFISTSAIIGFGGVAANLGMGLLWLTFMNLAFGIAFAFIVLGKRTRRIGHNLNAQTFPEILGKRFESRFIQGFGGIIIFLFMPLYSAAVMIGAARFLETTFPQIGFHAALIIYTLIICSYVLAGGLKGVMYSDAFQGAIMFAGMGFLLVFTYITLGGIVTAHQELSAIADKVPAALAAKGHMGWAQMPAGGTPLWWTLVTTIIMGVGIGALAQPQLAVRFMTVKSDKELNRAVMIGGIFILVLIGSIYIVGPLSNVFFLKTAGKISIEAAEGNVDKIIPMYITQAMPSWFVYLFMFTLLSAGMSTSSSQFHAMGTAIGRDLMRSITGREHSESTMMVTRMGIVFTVLVTVMLGCKLPGNIIAIATAVFFSICACTFLPVYVGALYWKGMSRVGAIAGMISGFVGSTLYLMFIQQKCGAGLGLCQALFGKPTLSSYPWNFVDPIVVVMPAAAVVCVVVSLFTQKPAQAHLKHCFSHMASQNDQ